MKNYKAYLKAFGWGAAMAVTQMGICVPTALVGYALGRGVNEKVGAVTGALFAGGSMVVTTDILDEYTNRVIIPKLIEEYKSDNFIAESPYKDIEEF